METAEGICLKLAACISKTHGRFQVQEGQKETGGGGINTLLWAIIKITRDQKFKLQC